MSATVTTTASRTWPTMASLLALLSPAGCGAPSAVADTSDTVECRSFDPTAPCFILFNDGVSLSLAAEQARGSGDLASASRLGQQAAAKLELLIERHPDHPLGESALAHTLYVAFDAAAALKWYPKAIARAEDKEERALLMREAGFAALLAEGPDAARAKLLDAFEVDPSADAKAHAFHELEFLAYVIGELGKSFAKTEPQKALANYRIAAGTLALLLELGGDRAQWSKALADATARLDAHSRLVAAPQDP